jgi:hypothetical protein
MIHVGVKNGDRIAEPVQLDVLAQLMQLGLGHARKQLGRRMNGQMVAPADGGGHDPPPEGSERLLAAA